MKDAIAAQKAASAQDFLPAGINGGALLFLLFQGVAGGTDSFSSMLARRNLQSSLKSINWQHRREFSRTTLFPHHPKLKRIHP
jgi:hypothetical protein